MFDFGGVMMEFDREGMVQNCADILKIPADRLNSDIKKHIHAIGTGSIDMGLFWSQVTADAKVTLPTDWKESFLVCTNKWTRVRKPMYALVDELRAAGYRVALLSDVDRWQAEAFRRSGLYDPFSPVLLSCEMGTHKPNREAYEILLHELGVSADRCIFIDDREENVAAACALGIHGILYTSVLDVRKALASLIESSP